MQIIEDAIGKRNLAYYNTTNDEPAAAYETIHSILCREYGIFNLVDGGISDKADILQHFLYTNKIDLAIDVIELCFKYILSIKKNLDYYKKSAVIKITPDEAISELNERFKEHGIGYQFEAGQIIRIDSTYAHSEITKPVLTPC